ncbi:MAG: NAD(P)/FAD-dependent oxidoreductase [Verrucomicrobia bacterium]|nr:NAD(P)/FAD-dependent oxidoreductase [Verrucomicrobiota bacterium]
MKRKVDIAILGQGLAGSLLAWRLMRAGADIHVWHEDLPGAASAVSPGLMTPLTGRKFTPIQNAQVLWSTARTLFAAMEQSSGRRFFSPHPVVRFFSTAEQRTFAAQHCADALSCGIGPAHVLEPGAHGELWVDPHGSVLMEGGEGMWTCKRSVLTCGLRCWKRTVLARAGLR